MATLDQFVANNLRPLNSAPTRIADTETDFRACGGHALIIPPRKEFNLIGLGDMLGILPYYDGDVISSESADFRSLLEESGLNPHHIFSPAHPNNRFIELVLNECLDITPYVRTENRMTSALVALEASISTLGSVLDSEYVRDILNTVRRIAENKGEAKVRQLLADDYYLGNALKSYLPMWEQTLASRQMPPEHDAVVRCYYEFKLACRSGTYTIGIPQSIRQSTFIHNASVEMPGSKLMDILITDTPEELNALAGQQSFPTRRIVLYRGEMDLAREAVAALEARQNRVICADIKGPKQLKEYLCHAS